MIEVEIPGAGDAILEPLCERLEFVAATKRWCVLTTGGLGELMRPVAALASSMLPELDAAMAASGSSFSRAASSSARSACHRSFEIVGSLAAWIRSTSSLRRACRRRQARC